MTYVATLDGTISLTVGDVPQLPMHDRDVHIVPAVNIPKAYPTAMVRSVPVRIPIQLTGSSKANMYAQESAIATALWEGTTLAVQSGGAASARTLNLLAGGRLELPQEREFAELREQRYLACDTIVAEAEPFWLGSEVTLYNQASIQTPGLFTLGTVLGDYPTPLEIAVGSPNGDLHSFYAGLLPPGSAMTYGGELGRQAEALTWYGGTTSNVGASASFSPPGGAGNARKNQSTSYATARGWNTRGYDEGEYIVLLRAAILDTAQTASFKLFGRTGWTADYTERTYATKTITGTGYDTVRWLRFGPIRLPVGYTVTDTGLADLWVGMKSSSAAAGDESVIDNAMLIPAAWGWVGVHGSAYDRDFATLKFNYDGTAYIDDAEDYRYVENAGPILAPPGEAKLAVASEVVVPYPRGDVQLIVKYIPRYATV